MVYLLPHSHWQVLWSRLPARSLALAFMCTRWQWLIPTIPAQLSHMSEYIGFVPKVLWFSSTKPPSSAPHLPASRVARLVEVTQSPFLTCHILRQQFSLPHTFRSALLSNPQSPMPVPLVVCCANLGACLLTQSTHTCMRVPRPCLLAYWRLMPTYLKKIE